MRVLILSQFYDPEPLTFPHELAVGLKEKGHQVSAITAIPNYPYDNFYPGYHLRPWIKEVRNGIPVIRLPLAPDHSTSSKRRILNYTSFMASSSLVGPWASGNFDVLYVWHPPLTLGVTASVIRMVRRLPFVYGVHDLWPEAVAATGISNNKTLFKTLRRLEDFVYKRAAAITVVSPGYKNNLIGKGVQPDKIHVFTDWADDSIYHPVPVDQSLAQELKMCGRFNILFGGNMGPAQGLETVIQTAKRLSHCKEIQFVFAGDGMDKPRLEALTQEMGLNNVRFLGRQPAEKMPQLYALSEVLLAHFKKDPLFEISVPSKLFAYLACQRPVLMAGAGDAAEIVKQAGAGLACEAEDPDVLAETVLKLYNMAPAQREQMGARGRQAFLDHYSKDVLVSKHEELFDKVAVLHASGKGR